MSGVPAMWRYIVIFVIASGTGLASTLFFASAFRSEPPSQDAANAPDASVVIEHALNWLAEPSAETADTVSTQLQSVISARDTAGPEEKKQCQRLLEHVESWLRHRRETSLLIDGRRAFLDGEIENGESLWREYAEKATDSITVSRVKAALDNLDLVRKLDLQDAEVVLQAASDEALVKLVDDATIDDTLGPPGLPLVDLKGSTAAPRYAAGRWIGLLKQAAPDEIRRRGEALAEKRRAEETARRGRIEASIAQPVEMTCVKLMKHGEEMTGLHTLVKRAVLTAQQRFIDDPLTFSLRDAEPVFEEGDSLLLFEPEIHVNMNPDMRSAFEDVIITPRKKSFVVQPSISLSVHSAILEVMKKNDRGNVQVMVREMDTTLDGVRLKWKEERVTIDTPSEKRTWEYGGSQWIIVKAGAAENREALKVELEEKMAMETVTQLLEREEPEAFAFACRRISESGQMDEATLPRFIERLMSVGDSVAKPAQRAIVLGAKEKAVDHLEPLLKSKEPHVRQHVADTIGALALFGVDVSRCEGQLTQIRVKDDRVAVKNAARNALSSIKAQGSRAISRLLLLARDPEWTVHVSRRLLAAHGEEGAEVSDIAAVQRGR